MGPGTGGGLLSTLTDEDLTEPLNVGGTILGNPLTLADLKSISDADLESIADGEDL